MRHRVLPPTNRSCSSGSGVQESGLLQRGRRRLQGLRRGGECEATATRHCLGAAWTWCTAGGCRHETKIAVGGTWHAAGKGCAVPRKKGGPSDARPEWRDRRGTLPFAAEIWLPSKGTVGGEPRAGRLRCESMVYTITAHPYIACRG
jgi:hypothetical protein